MKSMLSQKIFIAVVSGVFVMGCGGDDGPQLAPVSGTVTMGGQPLADVVVTFYPKGEGNSSSGTTNNSGEYTLKYTVDKDGAIIGEHEVRIVTAPSDNLDAPTKETIPAQYNSESKLVESVADENNTIDFQLDAN